MDLGILFGLAAAVCWGVTDIFARGASRSGGTFLTLLVVQVIAAPLMLITGLAFGLLRLTDASPQAIAAAAGIGLVILVGAGLLYRAFAIGSISLISPISASYSAITTLLALTLSGEHPKAPQLVGIVITLLGVVLASAVPGNPATDTSKHVRVGPFRFAPGLLSALLSMFIFGVAYWAMRFVVADLGGFTVVFVQKVGELAALVLIGIVVILIRWRRKPAKPAEPAEVSSESRNTGRRALLFVIFIVPMALLDTAANIAYTLGVAVSLTSIVSVLSSLFSPITVLLAWIFLRERLYRWQWIGVLAIFVGVVLVSV